MVLNFCCGQVFVSENLNAQVKFSFNRFGSRYRDVCSY